MWIVFAVLKTPAVNYSVNLLIGSFCNYNTHSWRARALARLPPTASHFHMLGRSGRRKNFNTMLELINCFRYRQAESLALSSLTVVAPSSAAAVAGGRLSDLLCSCVGAGPSCRLTHLFTFFFIYFFNDPVWAMHAVFRLVFFLSPLGCVVSECDEMCYSDRQPSHSG